MHLSGLQVSSVTVMHTGASRLTDDGLHESDSASACACPEQVDPFFAPVTEEEREEFGEEGQGVGAPNLARRLIDAVRRRKGLAVEEKAGSFPGP